MACGVLYLDFTETFQLLGKMNQNILQIGQSLVPNGLLVSSEKFNDLRSRAGTQAGGGRKTVHSPHSSYTTPSRLSVGRLLWSRWSFLERKSLKSLAHFYKHS